MNLVNCAYNSLGKIPQIFEGWYFKIFFCFLGDFAPQNPQMEKRYSNPPTDIMFVFDFNVQIAYTLT